jgi:hypothetical protein
VGAFAAKESAGPVAVGVGLGWILGAGPSSTRQFTRKLGPLLIALGLIVFLVDTKGVPRWLGTTYVYHDYYQQFGNGLGDLALAPFKKPTLFFSQILGPARLRFLFWTLAPFGFLPLLNWRAFIAALPGYLMLFLSEGDHRVSLIYHYSIEPSVGLFWALPGAILLLEPKLKRQKVALLPLWLLFCALATFGRGEIFRIRANTTNDHGRWIHQELLPALSPTASFAASGSLVPHLATRPWANHLPKIRTASGNPVSCIIEDPALNQWPLTQAEWDRLISQFSELGYTDVYHCGPLHLFEKTEAASSHVCFLSSPPPCP